MLIRKIIIFSFLFGFIAQAHAIEPRLYLLCQIVGDGVNPNIPRHLKAYINEEAKNWKVSYSVAGVPEQPYTLVASGDVYLDKRSRALSSAYFGFEDGTSLKINFKGGIGTSVSNNKLFRSLEKTTLSDCKAFEETSFSGANAFAVDGRITKVNFGVFGNKTVKSETVFTTSSGKIYKGTTSNSRGSSANTCLFGYTDEYNGLEYTLAARASILNDICSSERSLVLSYRCNEDSDYWATVDGDFIRMSAKPEIISVSINGATPISMVCPLSPSSFVDRK